MKNRIFKTTDTLTFSWDVLKYRIEEETVALIVLTGLYENGEISYDKLKGQIQSLRKGALTKYKRTYHCTINDKWYNDESFMTVFEDLFKYKSISYIKFIEVIQLFNGKNYNYAINYIVKNVFEPLLKHFSNSGYDYLLSLINTNIYDFPNIKQRGSESRCYECGHTHFENDYRRTYEQIDDIINYFHNFKNGTLTKIPKSN